MFGDYVFPGIINIRSQYVLTCSKLLVLEFADILYQVEDKSKNQTLLAWLLSPLKHFINPTEIKSNLKKKLMFAVW